MPTDYRTKALRRRIYNQAAAGYGMRPRSDWTFLLGGEYPTTPAPASEAAAMGLPPFGRGVALLANAVASTDWYAATWDGQVGVYQRKANQPNVVTEPDPSITSWQYRWQAVEDLVLYGRHVAVCGPPDGDNAGYPRSLVPVDATALGLVTPDPETGAGWLTINGVMLPPIDSAEPDPSGAVDRYGHYMLVEAGSRTGTPSQGMLDQYGMWLGGALAAESHAGSYFAGGALPPAVLQSPTQLTQDQADDLKSAWRQVANTREPVVLPMGYVLTPLVSNAEQNQLVESRQWNAEAVAMMLGIPAYKLGLPGTSMTYQNIETADIDFIRDSVSRFADPLAASFSKWLVPRGTKVLFDWAGRMRADQNTTASVLTTYTGAGILSTDEARAVLGRPPATAALELGTTPVDVPELTPAEVV